MFWDFKSFIFEIKEHIMTTVSITLQTEDISQIEAVKAVLMAMKIPHDISTNESPYKSEFVEKIKRSRKDYIDGKGETITVDALEALWK
ncbi:MAG: hypothetical protein ACI9V1_002554 [Spirosomataceae bacterium]